MAEIRIFGFNFAPKNWATCDGQTMQIAQNSALFALLGTTYGGNGKTTFNLPDLQGSVPMGAGNGPGLTPRALGEKSGSDKVTLTSDQLPQHNHGFQMSFSGEETSDPVGNALAGGPLSYGPTVINPPQMNTGVATSQGGSQPHNNLMPYQTLLFCIATQGVFPSRN